MNQLYKVLVDGKSCHGGSLAWNLPAGGQPGAWHEEVSGPLSLCRKGLHLTDDPARWWLPGCTVFLVEAEGVEGSLENDSNRKVVARRVRLLREATADELASLRIYTTGDWRAEGETVAVASGSSKVTASGSSQVTASGSSQVTAYDSSKVTADHNVTVVSWRGRVGVKLIAKSRALWVDRGDGDSTPRIHVPAGGRVDVVQGKPDRPKRRPRGSRGAS